MKIVKATIFYHCVTKHDEVLALRIYTDEGIYGDGEVAEINCGYATQGMLRDVLPQIIGRDPLDHEAIWDDLYQRNFFGQNGGQAFFSALSAIDVALWDIKGKYFNVPVYKLLGGKKREKLHSYASMVMQPWVDPKSGISPVEAGPAAWTPEQFAEYAKQAMAAGYDALKVDFMMRGDDSHWLNETERNGLLPAKTVKMFEDRVAAVREAIGPDADLIIEGHGFLDALASVQLAHAVEKYNILYFEEPCVPSVAQFKSVSNAVKMPIASGERIISRWEIAPYLESRCIKVLQPDIGNQGGITEAKKICDMAYPYGIGVQMHTCGTHLAVAAALHLETVIPNFVIHEVHMGCLKPLIQSYTTKQFFPENGYISAPEDPGLGVEWSDVVLNCKDQISFTE